MDRKLLDLEPNFLTIKSLRYIKNGDVLDLGCGEGRDSVFLSLEGFNVEAIDSSSNSIHNTNQLSKIYNVNLELKKENINKITFDKKYDLILCNFVLHFLKKDKIYNIINKIKNSTKNNGINVFSVLTEKNKNKFEYLFKEKELKKLYLDWEVLFKKEDNLKGIEYLIVRNSNYRK